MARPPIVKRSLIQRIQNAHEEAATEMENDMARIKGQRAYYQGSPSPPEIKRKVAKKMGGRY